jgi:Domain of unknown function (DUF4124)
MNRRLKITLGVAAWLMCAFISVGSVHAAEIYKWKDEKGVVHYSNTPPPKGTDSSVLDESKGKVSVVPAYKPPDGAAPPSSDPALQDRVRQLERQIDQERRTESSASQSQADAYQRWRADCLAQRRTDCDNPDAAVAPVYGDYPVPVAPVVRPPGRPVRPSYPNVVPPGYTVGPGPGGIGGAYVPNPPPLVQPGQPSPAPQPVPQPR